MSPGGLHVFTGGRGNISQLMEEEEEEEEEERLYLHLETRERGKSASGSECKGVPRGVAVPVHLELQQCGQGRELLLRC